ncbi:APC family permease [Cognatishimia activa]|uniref:Putative amino acid permease YhdG n=1 Tax=Cognatishimia activa TaxID=1715691 RepID=A0A0N7MBI6_9RHOB|nr:amino acid permease [Cognatishimia activa]CUJ20091.1 putative amino acid permease YhdG [Cognatishimia activa]CUK25512.1 putative amino acid permease YhdG [Cognatishimia activa]
MATLKRRVGLWLLTAYGVGVMVGAGIYVLVGLVAGEAGGWAPLSFLLAGLIVVPTALSYAEFSARIPEAAGEVAYAEAGFQSQISGILLGLAIVLVGAISAAAVLRGGVGYAQVLFPINALIATLVIGLALTLVAAWGVMESLTLAAIFTAIELIGLGLVIWAGFSAPAITATATASPLVWSGLGAGAVLAFFAFIGFEDIVNMAEEVRNPTRVLPRAILISLGLTTLIYILVAAAAVRVVPVSQLSGSEQPLTLVWSMSTGGDATFLAGIAVFAALNGVLAQIVMASRVLFGLGRRTSVLSPFKQVSPRRQTPIRATVAVGGLVLALALLVPIQPLAEATSTILLAVFVLINAALILEKKRKPEAVFQVPMLVPIAGLVLAICAFGLSVFGG